jgi:mono/diheme cytochrome c family protein
MKRQIIGLLCLLMFSGCATEAPPAVIDDCEELDCTTIMDAPAPVAGSYLPGDKEKVARGAYLIELLGCGACHTNGAFEGEPDMERALAGSGTGIAFSNPLGDERPGIIFPANITPDKETGIGLWSDAQIGKAIRAGVGRHGGRRIAMMPWPGYAKLTDDDLAAMVAFLRSIKPIANKVPEEVAPGQRARDPFVYFGVYRSKK